MSGVIRKSELEQWQQTRRSCQFLSTMDASTDDGQCLSFCNPHLRLCRLIGENDAMGFSRISRSITYPPRRLLFQDGSELDQLLILESGMVSLYKYLPDGRRQIIDFATSGEIVGAPGFGQSSSLCAQAVTHVHVTAVKCADLKQLAREHPNVLLRLFLSTPWTTETLHEHIVALGCKRADERMANFLVKMRHKLGKNGSDSIFLPMSRGDIADYLGMTAETVSRALAQLKKAKFIAFRSRSEVEFLDASGLARLGGAENLERTGCARLRDHCFTRSRN